MSCSQANVEYTKLVLASHNMYRDKHGTGHMTFDEDACATAQKWSEHLAEIGKMEHSSYSDRHNCGENLFGSFRGPEFPDPSKLWYREIKDYDFDHPGGHKAGHFTQLVWKASKKLGCAQARNGGQHWVTCHYCPAGNYAG